MVTWREQMRTEAVGMLRIRSSQQLFLANNWEGYSSRGNSGGLARAENHREEKLGRALRARREPIKPRLFELSYQMAGYLLCGL